MMHHSIVHIIFIDRGTCASKNNQIQNRIFTTSNFIATNYSYKVATSHSVSRDSAPLITRHVKEDQGKD